MNLPEIKQLLTDFIAFSESPSPAPWKPHPCNFVDVEYEHYGEKCQASTFSIGDADSLIVAECKSDTGSSGYSRPQTKEQAIFNRDMIIRSRNLSVPMAKALLATIDALIKYGCENTPDYYLQEQIVAIFSE